jgi:hypothetical protein
MARLEPTDPTFLAEYERESTWAPARGMSARSSFEHRNKPNGLPFLIWAGRVFIHKRGGDEYIASLVKRRNPPPRGRRSARRAEIEATTTT